MARILGETSNPRLLAGLTELLRQAGDAPRFRAEPVPPALLEELVQATTARCPVRFGEAPWSFVAVVEREREQLVSALAEALARHWGLGSLGPRGLASDAVLNAPALVLVFSTVPSSEGPEAFALTAGAVQGLILLAAAAGLATHRIYSANVVPEAVLDFVGERLGPGVRSMELVAMLAVGFPDAGAEAEQADERPPTRIGWIGRSDAAALPVGAPTQDLSRPTQVLRSPRGERVLVADGYPYNREQLAAQLGAAGYEVACFADGEGLLQAVAAGGEPGLYVISGAMPDVSGFELVRRLIGAGTAEGDHAPIVMTTGRRDSALRIAGLAAGVDYYLRKPVNPVELYTAARILLERRRLVVELRGKNLELGRLLGELRAAQARLVQQAKMASLGQLVAGVAHEINTPLGAVVSNNDLFLRAFLRLREALPGELPERARRDLEAVEQLTRVTRAACTRITGIVRTLRTFARLDMAEVKPVDLHEGIESTLTLVAHVAKPGTEIVREFGELPLVECHPNQINQVVMNLIVNAAQAIDEGGRITVRTRAEGERVRIEVADTGRGIAPEHLGRIFDPGFTTKAGDVGTGLGLMICEQIVEEHGGEISVASEVGRGTTFTVMLPVKAGGR